MTTTSRLLALLSLLQTHRDWPGPALAARLDTSARTVRRDIDRLREMGYRIDATRGPDGGYRLAAGSELPPLLFDEDQTVAIAIALQTVSTTGAGVNDAALRALATIRQVMPSPLRHRLDAVEVTALPRVGGGPAVTAAPAVLDAVSRAIRSREVLRFDYASPGHPDDDAPPRRTEPVQLIASDGRWYLLGWDRDREDWRLYRVDRLAPRTPNGPRFTPRAVPGGDAGEFVAARFRGNHVNEWACHGTVILDLPADDVRPFAGDGIVTALDSARCTLYAGSWSWSALAASFGRFDAPMRVVGPPELAAAFELLASRYADAAGREVSEE
ncbi:helix-turn-helix transcriptional regulator [Microbacterium sp. GXS0129]|uniref:helix-turn-helix transcriptional regulator n=1 Tax=Microbacterium sp. GXS0129 TaxID=3377836 RepID=UPI00383BDED6